MRSGSGQEGNPLTKINEVGSLVQDHERCQGCYRAKHKDMDEPLAHKRHVITFGMGRRTLCGVSRNRQPRFG